MPRIAIVGRPNVGKSSFLNMLARGKVSIVDPMPGTTRDRVTAIVELEDPEDPSRSRPVELIDTGGFGVYVAEGQRYDDVGADLARLTPEIEAQIARAVAEADLVLFAVDAQAGITPADREIAKLLREGKYARPRGGEKPKRPRRLAPVHVVATKVDGPRWEAHAHELAALGFGAPLMCSAKNNYMRRDVAEGIFALLPPEDAPGTGLAPVDLKLAIIGKRNSGKSTLVNTLAGEPRVIVSEIAGTTRDAIDVRFEMDGRSLLAIDTAGLRRKKSFAGRIEWFAFDRAKRSIERADVVLLMIDATEKVSQVDEQLAMLVQKSHKPVVIVVNKWDLAEGRPGPKGRAVTTEDFETYLRKELAGLSFAPIAFVSAERGSNVRETIDLAFEIADQSRTRVTTGKLNRLVQGVVEVRGPANKLGTRTRVYYVAQVTTRPPTILLVVNKPELFTPHYQRFLLNRFREELPYPEVPIRLLVRGRARGKTVDETVAEARRGVRDEEQATRAVAQPDSLEALPDEAEAYFED